MRFSVEHEFPASPDRVAALMIDADFVGSVVLPDLSPPEIVDHTRTDTDALVRVRYTYVGQLDPIGRRLLGNRDLVLVQTVALDLESTAGTLRLEAEADPTRLHGTAQIAITADGHAPDMSRRRLDGDFTVKVPLVGSSVERRLLPGILARFDVEAAALAARLRGSAGVDR